MTQATSSRRAVQVPRLITLVLFVLSLGYLLHTSNEPVVFGKYDAEYAISLAVLFFVTLPVLHLLARFCAVSHELKSRSGRTFILRPRHKVAFVLAAGCIAYLAAAAYNNRLISGRMMTYNGDAYHPYLQNTPLPNDAAQHVNRWGYRGDNIEQEKGANVFRIFVFGGSTVFCGTVPYEQSHCYLLERRLRQAYPQYQIEVQNLGTDWHSTEHDTIKLLFLAQDFSPDLVVTYHGINDLARSLTPDVFGEGPYWPDYRHYYGAASNLASGGRKVSLNVVTGHWCSDLRFDQIRLTGPEGKGLNGVRTLFVAKARPMEITRWQSLPAFERNLRDFIGIARSKDMQVLVATQPSLYRADLSAAEQQLLAFLLSHHFHGKRPSLKSMIEGMRRFNDTTRRVATEAGIELVDLERLMPKSTEYMFDDVHYTPAGNELVGNAFADHIIESQVIDRVMDGRAAAARSAAGE